MERASVVLLCIASVTLTACASESVRTPAPVPPRPAPSLVRPGEEPVSTAPVRETAPQEAVSESSALPDTVRGTEDALVAPKVRPQGAEASQRDPGEDPGEDPGRAAIGEVAGIPLYAEDVLAEWHQVAPREVWLLVDKLVATQLAFAEADRVGLRLAPERVEARLAASRDRLQAEAERAAPGVELEEFIRRELGQDPEHYLEGLRVGTIRQMVAERVVRTWTLQSEHAVLHVIVLPDEASATATLDELRAGADFEALARERSLDDSREVGGRVPFLVRQERSPLASLAFRTPPGALGGPLEVSGRFVILRVDELREPLPGRWDELRAPVEASLEATPLTDSEFLHWKVAMERRYPVDLRPLVRLLDGER